MKTNTKSIRSLLRSLAIFASIACSALSFGSEPQALVDDFSDPQSNSLGVPRQFLNDTTAGGSTTTEHQVSDGVLSVKGEIAPPRGQPGWASSILILDPQGLPQDISSYTGLRLLVKVTKGNLSISANSTDVTNFDYHAAPLSVKYDGKFHEVKIPFSTMKRAWSEQTPLNTKTIQSISIVAFNLQKGTYDFALDEISFY